MPPAMKDPAPDLTEVDLQPVKLHRHAAAAERREPSPDLSAPGVREMNHIAAQSQHRHDMEMRTAMLAIEFDRALAAVQALVARHDELQATCRRAQPPVRAQPLVPTLLRTAIKLARQQVRTQYPDLQSLLGEM